MEGEVNAHLTFHRSLDSLRSLGMTPVEGQAMNLSDAGTTVLTVHGMRKLGIFSALIPSRSEEDFGH